MIKCQKSIEVKCFCKNFTPTIDKEPLFLPQFRSNPVSPKLGNLLFDSTHFYINKKDSTLMILSLFGGFKWNASSRVGKTVHWTILVL